MPSFRYRALNPAGELVEGFVMAASVEESLRRIEGLGFIPVEASPRGESAAHPRRSWTSARPREEDVTMFSGDLALLLRTGARIDEALDLIALEGDVGRLRPTIGAIAVSIAAGESFGEAIGRHPAIFPPLYVALAKVGEASGTLTTILESLARERQRGEAMRRRLTDALRYPTFLLFAAAAVLTFFLTFVLPQFAGVFRDFNAKLDPVLVAFLGLSEFLRQNAQVLAALALAAIAGGWLSARRPSVRHAAVALAGRLPVVGPAMDCYRATLFCRNLSLLLQSGVTLSESLKILAGVMAASGGFTRWSNIQDSVRRGGRLSAALAASGALPPMAAKTLRLGEDSGQLPALAARVADFYEAKLQRSLDRVVGIVGPAAIILISLIVGGLIVSVMTALLSVNQMAS